MSRDRNVRCGNSTCINVVEHPDGGVLISAESTLPGEEVHATAKEWDDFEGRIQGTLRAKIEALVDRWPAGLGNTGEHLRDNLRAVLSGEYDPRESS